jgi:phosphoribosyl 1,2-cyclic phosphodiesterase
VAAKQVSNRALVVEGARGSMSVAGPDFRRYGGHTTCFSVEVSPGHHLVFDCGTGLQNLQKRLPPGEPREFTVFLTHYHWDHIQGLPMFSALNDPRNRFTFHGPGHEKRPVQDLLGGVLRPPWFPVTLDERPAGIVYRDLEGPIEVGGLLITPIPLRHPQGCVGYRVDGERSVMIATDHEAGDAGVDEHLAGVAGGVDVVLHDGQYTEEEYRIGRQGWGHSTWVGAVDAAVAAGAGRLVVTSHDPTRSDDEVDEIVKQARGRFPLTSAAHPGMRIPL